MSLGTRDPANYRILVVDDDEDIREFLKTAIEREGFAAVMAETGKQALERIAESAPHLMILDLMMPGLSGYEVLHQLQQQVQTMGIPIIILTGRMMDPTTVETFRRELNVAKFMQKPVRPSELAGYLHAILDTEPRHKDTD